MDELETVMHDLFRTPRADELYKKIKTQGVSGDDARNLSLCQCKVVPTGPLSCTHPCDFSNFHTHTHKNTISH